VLITVTRLCTPTIFRSDFFANVAFLAALLADLLTSSIFLGPPSAAPRINNNHSVASPSSGGSNVKRGGVDTNAIKDNTSRYSAGGVPSSRPATASASTKTQGIDSSRECFRKLSAAAQRPDRVALSGATSPKTRITKSNTMSNATGRTILGQPTSHRKSAYETGSGGGRDMKLSSSNDKTNQIGGDPRYDPRVIWFGLKNTYFKRSEFVNAVEGANLSNRGGAKP
jgi:hypothetical protein